MPAATGALIAALASLRSGLVSTLCLPYFCHTAGPVNIHDNVLRAMQVPGQNHRDPWFAPFFQKLVYDTRYIYQTKAATPFIFPGTGTGGWEAALTNTLSPGDKVITFR